MKKRQIELQKRLLLSANRELNVTMQTQKKEMTIMDKRKKKVLKSKGYKVGSVDEFLGLSKKESDFIELKLALSEALSERRKRSNLTQAQLAKRAGVPQSHIANIEKGKMTPRLDTLDKILKALFCNMLVVPKPTGDLDDIIHERIKRIARKKVDSVAGTMRLEDQSPPFEVLDDMLREEEAKMMQNPTSKIWED